MSLAYSRVKALAHLMLRESPRPPNPINWEEQERIFRRLPDHMARMALFAVTGLRDANLCGLRWSWEVGADEHCPVWRPGRLGHRFLTPCKC